LESRLGKKRSEPQPAARTVIQEVEVGDEVAVEAVPLEDDMPPLWPDEAAEVAYLTEEKAKGIPLPSPATMAAEEMPDSNAPLPDLEDLVRRIPPAVRVALEENFRAKFSKVVRVPKAVLSGKR
jgi:hypothetical protein